LCHKWGLKFTLEKDHMLQKINFLKYMSEMRIEGGADEHFYVGKCVGEERTANWLLEQRSIEE